MAGKRAEAAKRLAYTFNTALGRLDVPTFIGGHTTRSPRGRYGAHITRRDALDLRVYKTWSEPAEDPTVLRRLNKISGDQQNVDAEAIAWAARILGQRREPTKVLFYLSDGHPAAHYGCSYDTVLDHYHKTLERIRASGIIVVCCAIRTKLEKVKRDFDYFVEVNDTDAIVDTAGAELVKVLRTAKRDVLR